MDRLEGRRALEGRPAGERVVEDRPECVHVRRGSGGERLTDVSARVESFIADLATDDLVVAVSHVSPIKAAVCIALDVGVHATWNMHLELASLTRIGFRPGGVPFLQTYNDITYR